MVDKMEIGWSELVQFVLGDPVWEYFFSIWFRTKNIYKNRNSSDLKLTFTELNQLVTNSQFSAKSK